MATPNRKDTAHRLNRLLWLERAKSLGIVAAIMLTLAAVFSIENLDLAVQNSRVSGVVEAIEPLNIAALSDKGVRLNVRLTDGRHIRVIADKAHEPLVGDTIEVSEHKHGTGRITYTLAAPNKTN